MKIPRKPTLPGWNHSRVLQVAWFAMTLNETLWAMVNHCRWLGKISLGSLPLDKTIVFHFYDFVLVLSVVFSRCQLYSVSLSQRKLIPNSALFILPFREFYAWVSTKDGFGARPAKTRYSRSIESFSFEWNTHRERDYDKGSWCPSFRVGLPSIILIETQRGQVRSSEGFRCHFRANSRRLRR